MQRPQPTENGTMQPKNKTERFLHSFQSVELLPEHRNWGNQYPTLRDYGISGQIATKLIRWGETEELVCTFTDSKGVGPNAYSWMPAFIKAAAKKHVELFGELGKSELPQAMLEMLD